MPLAAGALRVLGGLFLLVGAAVAATTTGRGSDWALRPDGAGRSVGVDVNDLLARDPGWAVLVGLVVAGTWAAAWVGLAALPRGRPGRVLVSAVFVVPPALLALDAAGSGGRGPWVAVVLLLVAWPVPLGLLWTGAHRSAARLSAGAALVGAVALAVTALRLGADPGRLTLDLWLAVCGTVLVLVGALLLAVAARPVSP